MKYFSEFIQPGHLLVITNQFTKFQGSRTNSCFYRYFADKAKMPKFTKGHFS